MTIEITATTIDILGKTYQLKCPEQNVASLKQAAHYLEKKIQAIRETNQILSIDRIAMITALNITHEYLVLEKESRLYSQLTTERLRELQNKIEQALAKHAQLELSSAD